MSEPARDSECRFTPAWQPGADANLQRAGKQPSAAQDRDGDVQAVLDALMGREPTALEWAELPVLRALARIDQRLAAGAAMAAVVDECVKAGHITAVPS